MMIQGGCGVTIINKALEFTIVWFHFDCLELCAVPKGKCFFFADQEAAMIKIHEVNNSDHVITKHAQITFHKVQHIIHFPP